MTATTGTYDEALERLHRYGPEFEGWLSNHGPMVVEAMSRRGADDGVHRWTEAYLPRLEHLPTPNNLLTAATWQEAVGDHTRIGDWIAWFQQQLAQQPWRDVLAEWWPRLLPGIAAGATHGGIRTGHAVKALRDATTQPRQDELAQALGYWAARFQRSPVLVPAGHDRVADLVTTVPRVAEQDGGIRERLAQLPATAGWAAHGARLAAVTEAQMVPAALGDLVDAVVSAYASIAHGQPTMLVHAATAPNAVAMALPSLPTEHWLTTYSAAWSASAAVLAAYLPATPAPPQGVSLTGDDVFDLALRHGGEHVIKLADTALTSHARTGDPRALAAVTAAIRLDA